MPDHGLSSRLTKNPRRPRPGRLRLALFLAVLATASFGQSARDGGGAPPAEGGGGLILLNSGALDPLSEAGALRRSRGGGPPATRGHG